MSHSSKGSRPRPFSVTQDEYDRRWDAIFARDLDEVDNEDSNDVVEEIKPAEQDNTQ
jgi:hypothetical protein